MKKVLLFCLIILVSNTACVSVPEQDTYKPLAGYVPDKNTATRIAVAVWIPIYGEKQIESQKPYHAKLKGGVWTVTGSLPENTLGGVALAEISKDDGRILRISHGK